MLRTTALASLCATLAAPAPAQWLAVGRWGSEQNFRYVPPGTWMALTTDTGAEISAEGDNHVTRLTLACERGETAAQVELSRYFGYDIPREEGAQARFLLVIEDIRMQLDFVWSEAAQAWVSLDAFDSDTLALFGWANRLHLLGADEADLATYRMNGSTAALGTLRRACGL